ncbi:MAG: ABC transporter ATP-binding protein [Candidatus Moraniibacteriota bacterium]
MDSPFPLIQVDNLCKTYDNEGVKTQAICGVTFDIEKGEFVSIMGPSGSGKSTLMHILGLLDRPSDGKYYLDGQDVLSLEDNKLAELRNKKIGFVFQAFNLLPRTTVFENVELPLIYDKSSGKNNRARVMAALKAVGIENRKDYFSNQLSGGEKQRVAMARALVNDPEVIFADEPTGNLDSKTGVQVMEILEGLNNHGHTIILVTHETITASYAKRIIKILDGKIISDREVSEKRRKIAENHKKIK